MPPGDVKANRPAGRLGGGLLCAHTATIGAEVGGSRPTSKFGHWWHASRFLQMTYVEARLAIAAVRVDLAGLHDN
jgi:hypothetical protein